MTSNHNSPEFNYTPWLVRDSWSYIEAACLFNGSAPEQTIHTICPNFETYNPPQEAYHRELINIFKTWAEREHPFYWINKALLKEIKIPEKLWEKIGDTFLTNHKLGDQNITKLYPAIAKKLNVNSASQQSSSTKKENTSGQQNEKNTLLKIILGMAIDSYNYDPKAARSPATGSNHGSIKAALDKLGIDVSEDTIRSHLNAAKDLCPAVKKPDNK